MKQQRSLRKGREPAKSPLYTPKADAEVKQQIVRVLGKDTDGVARVRGRQDKGDRV